MSRVEKRRRERNCRIKRGGINVLKEQRGNVKSQLMEVEGD